MNDLISRQAAIKEIIETYEHEFPTASGAFDEFVTMMVPNILRNLPSAQPEQRPLTEDNYAYCAECDQEMKCLSCGHHIAERPFEVYCNIMCKWVIEKDCCTMFEPGQRRSEEYFEDKRGENNEIN